jgi:hypothetical protein
MDSKHIEELLEKYWNCQTSLEEEEQLRAYFKGDGVPERWKETSELFRYFQLQKKDSLTSGDLEGEVLRKIKSESPRGKGVRMVFNIARIAAGLIVVAVATFLVRQEIRKSYPPEIVDTYSDPKLALEETKKAFLMISKSFGKAQEEAKKINLINEAEQKIGTKKDEKKTETSI